MTYYLQNETTRAEHSPAELIRGYESGRLNGAVLVAAKGDTSWYRLDFMLSHLRRDAGGPLYNRRARIFKRLPNHA
jgi:hypothetical protein